MNASRPLVLIRHATPVLDFTRPARCWELSEAGLAECRALAERLSGMGMTELVSSEEPKAAGTARAIAAALGIGWRTAPGLHEHERGALPAYPEAEWQALLRRLFEHPDELVMGLETANQALARFTSAVEEGALDGSGTESLGIVSHGTVIALYVAAHTGEPAYEIWQRLKLADYVELGV